MLRTKIVLTTGLLVGAAAIAATPLLGVELREDAPSLGRSAIGSGPASASSAPIAAPAANVDRAASGNPLWAIPLRELTATRERPLFAPTRRPPPPVVSSQLASVPPPPPKPVEPDRPSLKLVGTVVDASQSEGVGIFVDPGVNRVVRIKVGEGRAGWVLKSVEDRKATFENDVYIVTLALPGAGVTEQVVTVVGRRANGQLVSLPFRSH